MIRMHNSEVLPSRMESPTVQVFGPLAPGSASSSRQPKFEGVLRAEEMCLPVCSAPGTPQVLSRDLARSSPPAAPKMTYTQLSKALVLNSETSVLQALQDCPDAVRNHFFDCDFEPVLCTAVRSNCCPRILRMLLAHHADVSATDKRGRNALTLLSSIEAGDASKEWITAWSLACARILVEGGAKPLMPDGSGRLPVQAARRSGNNTLASYLEFCLEVQAASTLCRAHIRPNLHGCKIGKVNLETLMNILTFLLPASFCCFARRALAH